MKFLKFQIGLIFHIYKIKLNNFAAIHEITCWEQERSSVSSESENVSSLPVASDRWSLLVTSVALDSESSVLSTSGGETSVLSVLVLWVAEPVDSWVVSDGVVGGIDHDALVVLVGTVLTDPVGVKEGETTNSLADSLLGERSEVGVGQPIQTKYAGGQHCPKEWSSFEQ